MNRDDLIHYIHSAKNIKLVSENEILSGSDINEFFCEVEINDSNVSVRVLISNRFPEILPKFYLEKYNLLGFIPHVEPDGSICYLEKESIYVNADVPHIVFEASVDLAIKTIEDGLNGNNHKDFREEFQVFWERNPHLNKLHLVSFIDVGTEPKIIQITKNDKTALVSDLKINIENQKKALFKNNQSYKKTGVYIPMSIGSDIIPPEYDTKWPSKEFIYWLKQNVTAVTWNLLQEQILNNRPERFQYVILGIPRNTGATILVGIKLKPKSGTSNPLLDKQYDWKLSPLKVTRLDSKSIFPRGGANIDLQKKKVLLVGCGSVGSQTALMICKTGIGFLDLVDYDTFKLENIQRYALGLSYIGKNKSVALKDYIKQNFIGVTLNSFENKIEDLLRLETININDYDLIISATGDPNVNFSLSKTAINQKISLITCWNEPYGIGGHVILNVGNQSGCYKCLYKNTHNLASFASENQPKPFHKKHLGCGEVFTPYSILDSVQTSQLTVRLANKFLLGKIDKSTILSWVGESDEFLNNGFNLSERYLKQTQDEMYQKRSDFINPNCTYCNF